MTVMLALCAPITGCAASTGATASTPWPSSPKVYAKQRVHDDGKWELFMHSEGMDFIALAQPISEPGVVHIEVRWDRPTHGQPCRLHLDGASALVQPAEVVNGGSAAAIVDRDALLTLLRQGTLAGRACDRWQLQAPQQGRLVLFLQQLVNRTVPGAADGPEQGLDPATDLPLRYEPIPEHPVPTQVEETMAALEVNMSRCAYHITTVAIELVFGSAGELRSMTFDPEPDSVTRLCLRKNARDVVLPRFTAEHHRVSRRFRIGSHEPGVTKP